MIAGRRRFFANVAVVVASLILTSAVGAQNTPSAPFGLGWLQSADAIRALGVTLTNVDGDDFGVSYSATNLPKALSDLETVILSFGYNDKLYRIAALSREFESDDYGTSARSRYDEIASSLSKSYTSGEVYERRPTDSFYGEAENFSYAISQKKAFWFRMFSSLDADIELSIGSNHTDTYWRLIYTHREGLKQFEAKKGEKELDAL